MINEARQWKLGKWIPLDFTDALVEEVKKNAVTTLSEIKVVVVINVDENGISNAKAMYPAYKDGIAHIWFNTDATSKRFHQLKNNPDVTVYCYDDAKTQGVMLKGRASVEEDRIWRKRLWKKEFEEGYLGGVDDPDYQVMRFDAEWCNYFGQSRSVTFSVT